VACNCGGSSEHLYLVTGADGKRRIVGTEPAARIAVVVSGGGTWRRVDTEEAARLGTEGVPFS
jgi:hypothetical protein